MQKIKKIYLKYKEIFDYLLVGGLTTIVALGSYYMFVFTILNPNDAFQLQVANILSWLAGVLFAYFTNRKFVFKSKNPNKIKEASKFTLTRVITLLLDMFLMFLGVTLLNFNDKIIKLISQILVVIGNYIFSKLFVFKKESEN